MSEPRQTGRFPASRRLRKRAEFQRVQAGGRRVVTEHFVLLLFAPIDSELPTNTKRRGPRVGITVSRRVGKAVIRNRAKRLIREAFRRTLPLWPEDLDVVVIARQPPGHMKMQEVIDEWQNASGWIRRRTLEARADRDARESALANPR